MRSSTATGTQRFDVLADISKVEGALQNLAFCNAPLKNRLRAMNCGPHFASYRRETALFPSLCVYSFIVQRPLFVMDISGTAAFNRTLYMKAE